MPGKNKQPLIIVDADALISFINEEDANHLKAKKLMQYLADMQASLLYPSTAICEAVTVLRTKLNRPADAGRVMTKLQNGDFPLQAVDQEIINHAASLFDPQASKKNTLFDAVVAAIAKRLDADAIFSFDEWYKKIGIPLVSALPEQTRKAG